MFEQLHAQAQQVTKVGRIRRPQPLFVASPSFVHDLETGFEDTDPLEMVNLADQPESAELARTLTAELDHWKHRTKDPFPEPTPPAEEPSARQS